MIVYCSFSSVLCLKDTGDERLFGTRPLSVGECVHVPPIRHDGASGQVRCHPARRQEGVRLLRNARDAVPGHQFEQVMRGGNVSEHTPHGWNVPFVVPVPFLPTESS